MHLVYLGAAWLGGIALASYWAIPANWLLVMVLVALIPLVFWIHDRRAILAAAALLLAFLAVLRYQSVSSLSQEWLGRLNDKSATCQVTGLVVEDPQERDTRVSFRLAVQRVRIGDQTEPAKGDALVYTQAGDPVRYGDIVVVEGKLQTPSNFADFDYREYLARQGVSSVIYGAHLRQTGDHGGLPFLGFLYDLRHALASSLQNSIPTPEAALARGLVLGGSQAMPADLQEAFRRSGLLHIVAISGYNMSLVAGLMLGLGRRLLGRRKAALLAGASIALFAVFWGPQPSVLRAAIMAGISLLAIYVGRPSFAPNALILSAVILSALDPFVLQNISFQLSFAATAGILFLAPILSQWLDAVWPRIAGLARWNPAHPLALAITESVSLTLGATFTTLPIAALNFHMVTLASPIANLLVAPAIPVAMLLASVQSVVGLAFLPAAQTLTLLTWVPLHFVVKVAEACAGLPLAALTVGHLDAATIALVYAGLVALIWRWTHRKPTPGPATRTKVALSHHLLGIPTHWLLLGGSAFIIAFPWAQLAAHSMDRVVFFDVGQGDAIFIETRDGHTVLVDGGPSSQLVLQQLDAQLPFWDRRLDLVVATHAHEDHTGGLYGVVQRYAVGQILDGTIMSDAPGNDRWQELAKEKGIPRVAAQAGQSMALGRDSRLEVLAAASPSAGSSDDGDAQSLVLRFASGQVSFLLTADVRKDRELEMLAADLSLASKVLKVPHHGAKEALDPAFLAAVQPEIAVISVGADNPYGHPAEETLRLLAGRPTIRTDQSGTITFTTNGQDYWISTNR